MTVKFAYRNVGAPDVYRRGLRPETAPLEVLLVDIEADLVIRDGDRVVMEEGLFPVAELARDLADWLRRPDDERGDFEFDSMSYAEVGEVRIVSSGDGWQVGCVSEPDSWTSPVGWDVLVAEIGQFVNGVRKDVMTMGVDPGLIPGLAARYGQRAVLLHVENETHPAIPTDSRPRAGSEPVQLLPPGVEVPLEEIELKPGIDEASVRQNLRPENVVAGQDTGLEATGHANDAAVALRVLQVDQVHRV